MRPVAMLVLALGASLAFAVQAASAGPRSLPASARSARAQPMEQLTPAQRNNLPDATTVRLPGGRTETLGVLRSEHRMRLARFARAAHMEMGGAASDGGAQQFRSSRGKLVAAKRFANGPLDYRSFCNAAHVSACLWFPPNSNLINQAIGSPPTVWQDVDVFIIDKGVCRSDGGVINYYGQCTFNYPAKVTFNFRPGSPPPGKALGAGVTWTKRCASTFQTYFEALGAVVLYAPSVGGRPQWLATGAKGSSCVASVFLPKR